MTKFAQYETSFLVRISGPLLLLVPMFLPPLCPSRRRRGGQFVIRASLGMASDPRSANGTAMGSGDGFRKLESILCHRAGTVVISSNYWLPIDVSDRPIMHYIGPKIMIVRGCANIADKFRQRQ